MPRIRVTAQVDGKAKLVVDEELGPIDYEAGEKALWGADSLPVKVPLNASNDCKPLIAPLPGGLRVRLLQKGGPNGGGPQSAAARAKSRKAREHVMVTRDEKTTMHTTNTVDILFVFSGECGYELRSEERRVGKECRL